MARSLTALAESRITLAFSILILIGAWAFHTWEPTPYRDVELRSYEATPRTLRFVATFEKTACEFQKLTVVGSDAGETELLNWQDLDGSGPDVDRIRGRQTLRLEVALKRRGYDWVEVRTRHDCEGRKVDKVFIRFDDVP